MANILEGKIKKLYLVEISYRNVIEQMFDSCLYNSTKSRLNGISLLLKYIFEKCIQ